MIELVFIHGWGFDPRLWDAVADVLKQFRQTRVDLGFFGNPNSLPPGKDKILIGHSFGFVHGIKQKHDWAGWVSINGFPRFVETKAKPGCTSAAALRDIRLRLQADAGQALKDFYGFIGAKPPIGQLNAARLREGLDELRDADVEDDLATLDASGLVLASRDDPLVPLSTSEALGRMASDGLKLHDSGGHILPQSAPDWCAAKIAEFITACLD